MAGVTVLIEGTNKGTVTNFDGQFSITLEEGQNVLVFSSLGYKTERFEVNGNTTINLVMTEDLSQLEEVVLIGYGEQKREDVTGAISSNYVLKTGYVQYNLLATTAMLSKGTTKNDKFQFSQKLEKLGVDIYVGSDSYHVTINFKCLSQDIDTVIALLAEELRHPLFDEKEFDLLKQQYIGNLQQGLSNPGMRGRIAMTQALYPKDHPNYSSSVETTIENIQNAELDEIKAFHKSYFGPKAMVLVGVGDVDEKTLYKTLEKNFKAWKGGMDRSQKNHQVAETVGQTKIITIPEKPSAELFIGQYTGIQRSDVDFLPLYIGNSVLGGGFSGRLMKTVRDDAGLTYGISSRLEGYTYSRGYWYINASFNPELLNKGKEMTLEQLRTWYQKGITAQELSHKKSNLIGSFKIGLSTTPGMARNILAVVQRGQAPGYIYEYPKELEAVTLEEVNAAIKKYIDIDNLVIVEAGSIDQNGNPME